MTQAIATTLASANRVCANCPFFQSHNEPEHLTDDRGKSFPNPRREAASEGSKVVENDDMGAYALRWCKLFDQPAKEHHQMTKICVGSGALDVEVDSHELENNLDFFPKVEFDESELEAFPSEELIDPYDLPYSEYEVGSLVKVIDKEEHHSEWSCFEVIEVKPNIKLYESAESYLNGSPWHYLLASIDTVQKLDGIWAREDEICHFDESHLICTEPDLFF